MNVLHSSMEITDQFYSNLNDGEIAIRISLLGSQTRLQENEGEEESLVREFIRWKKNRA